MFATTPWKAASSALQTITIMPELHIPNLGPAEAAEKIQELEDELFENMKCIKRNMDRLTSQLMQFDKVIQANDKIISEQKKELNVQKHRRWC
jgi:hypothetical protein